MADRSNKLPVPTEKPSPGLPQEWRPLERLRHEIDRLFEDFGGGFFRGSLFDAEPFPGSQSMLSSIPAVDVTETDKAYEITAQLPGMDEKSVELKLANGVLSIKAEKHDEKREEKNGYYESSFSSFQRAFAVPDDVDANEIEATFKNGVLSVTLPKAPDTKKPVKRIGKAFDI
jgi:HSP20 family protein